MRNFNVFIFAVLVSALSAAPVAAAPNTPATKKNWTPADLPALEAAFVSGISGKYSAAQYPFRFLSTCGAPYCFGTNPDTTYGQPDFSGGAPQPIISSNIAKTGAYVLVMETPPPMQYWGVTPYIFNRYYSSLPTNPSTSGFVTIFESLTDTANLLDAGTTGSTTPGVNPFSQLSVYIVTADQKTYSDIANEFVSLGFPATAINLLDLPLANVPGVPLDMGVTKTSDTYTLLLRLTYPTDPAQMQAYVTSGAQGFYYLTPLATRPSSPLPPTTYKVPGDGQSEPQNLLTAQGALVSQLLNQLKSSFGAITESPIVIKQTDNYICVTGGFICNSDNPDAFDTADVGNSGNFTMKPTDAVLVVGVMHDLSSVGTGKATYFSHSVVNDANQQGIIAVNNQWLAGTALTAAGIKSSKDPRYATYQSLYAFMISYNCPATAVPCLTIPQGSGSAPGIPVGTVMQLTGRFYLDPTTKTRPSTNELIIERAFYLTNP
jgi:hypothetical protein